MMDYSRYGIPNNAVFQGRQIDPRKRREEENRPTIDISMTGVPYAVKQGMIEAKAQGWSPEKIQQGMQQDMFRNYLMEAMKENGGQPGQPAPQQGGGSLIDPSAWIREIGGSAGAVGGAAGGAALGTAIMPGIGTVLGGIGGGILGAFGGGSAGSAVEQQVRDGSVDMDKVWREGLQEAPWGALPGVGKAIGTVRHAPKGAKMAALLGKTGQAGSAGSGAIDDVGKLSGKRPGNILQRSGASMRQGVVSPKTPVSPRMASQQRQVMDVLHKYGFKGSASKQLNQLDEASRLLSDKVDDALKANPTIVKMSGRGGVLDDLGKHATGNLEATPAIQREVKRTVADIGQQAKSGNMLDLRNAQKRLGDRLSRAFDKIKPGGSGVLTDKEMVDLEIWSKLDDILKANAGDAKSLLSDHSKLFDAAHGIAKEAGRTIGLPMAGIRSGTLARTSQAARDMTGRGLVKAGDALSFAGGASAPFRGNPLVKQVAARGILGGGGVPSPDSTSGAYDPADPFSMGFSEEQLFNAAERSGIDPNLILPLLGINEQPQQDPMAGQMGGFGGQQPMGQDQMAQQMGGMAQQQGTPGMVIPRDKMVEAMMIDMQATGGENIDKMMKIFEFANYDALNAVEAEGDTEQQAKMQTAKTIIDNLMTVYSDVGGAKGIYSGTGTDLLGRLNIGEGNEKARAYEQNRMSYLTPIIKAFGEVGVLTDKDREVVAAAIPSIKDSPAQAEQKINLLYQMLMSLGNGGSISGTDEQSLLEQQLGGFVGGV